MMSLRGGDSSSGSVGFPGPRPLGRRLYVRKRHRASPAFRLPRHAVMPPAPTPSAGTGPAVSTSVRRRRRERRLHGQPAGSQPPRARGQHVQPGGRLGRLHDRVLAVPRHTSSDGERILSWDGSDRGSAAGESRLGAQGLRCFIRDRKLVWDFQNLFKLPGAGRIPVTAPGHPADPPARVAPPSPALRLARRASWSTCWTGVPEAIVHVTDTRPRNRLGRRARCWAAPSPARSCSAPGSPGSWTSFASPDGSSTTRCCRRFLGKTGVATTRIIDLGFSATRIARIESVDVDAVGQRHRVLLPGGRHVGRQEGPEDRHGLGPLRTGNRFRRHTEGALHPAARGAVPRRHAHEVSAAVQPAHRLRAEPPAGASGGPRRPRRATAR